MTVNSHWKGSFAMQSSTSTDIRRPALVQTAHEGPNLSPTQIQFGTLSLVSLASLTLTAAQVETAMSVAWLTGTSVAGILTAWFIAILRRWKPALGSLLDTLFPLLGAAWILSPIAIEISRRLLGSGDAWELMVLRSLQNAALVAAAHSHLRTGKRLAGLLGSFLVLFVITISSSRYVYVLAGVYGVLMLWWFIAGYWEKVQHAVVANSSERCLPIRASVLGLTLLVVLLFLSTIASRSSDTFAMQGFMPSSGGDSWGDEFARGGVGDGPAMVAAKEEAMSFGPVESELFLDSEMPSLYDMFNDMYGEPPKPKTNRERTIGLASEDEKESEQRRSQSTQNGREFSTLRRLKDRKESNSLKDRNAAAMLYVVGQVPLHLALERHNTFDGTAWSYDKRNGIPMRVRMEESHGMPWAYFDRFGASPNFRGVISHKLKVINLKTNRIPSPPHLTAVHIDKLDRLEFYGWSDDAVACMPVRDRIPQLTVMHVRSQAANLQALRESDFTKHFPKVDREFTPGQLNDVDLQAQWMAKHLEVPHRDQEVSQFAATTTEGIPRGWRQVEAIVNRLRQEFTHDREATLPEGCENVVGHFLQKRRGPDYLFATTAATLLRELGYPTRLVSGFYAREDRYDRRSGQTAVLPEDVHVWVEVQVDRRTWVPIEPTPGYERPFESLTWAQWLASTGMELLAWCQRHIAILATFACGMVILFATRKAWLDFLARQLCQAVGVISLESRIYWTIRLLEFRARLIGCCRPKQRTITAWYAPLVRGSQADLRLPLAAFLQWADRLLYSSGSISEADRDEVERVCNAVIVHGGRRVLRECLIETRSNES